MERCNDFHIAQPSGLYRVSAKVPALMIVLRKANSETMWNRKRKIGRNS